MPLDHPRAVVLGGAGMLGHRVFLTLREYSPAVVCTVRRRPPGIPPLAGADVVEGVDLMNLDEVDHLLRCWRPELVVNCAGIVKQRAEAHDAVACLTINALLPHRVARTLEDWGGRLIHFSTDCVFTGRKGSYRESDPADAEDLYGRSKLLGEVDAPNALTLRTSMIGRELTCARGLLEWLLASEGRVVRGYRRAVYSGLTTPALAGIVAELWTRRTRMRGVYHVAGDPISKFSLLHLLKDAFGIKIEIRADDEVLCGRSLIDDRFRAATGTARPSWAELVRELAADRTTYTAWKKTGITEESSLANAF